MSVVAAARKRHTGTQSRTAYLRLFAMIDRDLASEKGLSISHFCDERECSIETVRRYLLDLVEIGVGITQRDGIWRYVNSKEPIFNAVASELLSKV